MQSLQKITLASLIATSSFALSIDHDADATRDTTLDAACFAVANHLVINEVAAGPQASYIELFNASRNPVSLRGLSLESSQGVVSLDDVTENVPAGGYFLLLSGRPEEVGVSPDPDILLKIVSQPVTGVLGDTILLSSSAGVDDAVCYGEAAERSLRYRRAVLAGQFANGQFVDIARDYGASVIGRDARGTDSNDLASDWATGGGKSALVGSPLLANSETLGGEDFAVKAFQSRFNQLAANTYYNLSVRNGSYSNFAGSAGMSSATHTFLVDSGDFGPNITLSGKIDYRLVMGVNGGHTIIMSGVLASSSPPLTMDITMKQTVVGAATTSSTDCDLTDLTSGDVLPYNESVTLQHSGKRGAFAIAQSRAVFDLDGIKRSTQASESITWNVAGGQVASVDVSADIARDYPETCWPYSWGTPRPVYTTEVIHFDLDLRPNAVGTGFDGAFSNYVRDYGPQFGIATYDDASMAFRFDPTTSNYIYDQAMTITYPAPGGNVVPISSHYIATGVAGAPNVDIAGDLLYDGNVLASFQLSIDPPAYLGDPWYKKAWRGVKTGAKWAGHAAATVVTGGACAIATTATAGAAGITSWSTLGAATPGGIAATGAVGGGCVYLSNVVYEGTKPN